MYVISFCQFLLLFFLHFTSLLACIFPSVGSRYANGIFV